MSNGSGQSNVFQNEMVFPPETYPPRETAERINRESDAWRPDWPDVASAEVPGGAPIETRSTVTNRERTMESENTGHQHTPEEERRIREAALDKTIADSFPASDPPSSDPNPDDHSAIEGERPADASQAHIP